MQRGKFIVFEGLDGSGSSSNSKLLVDWLNTELKQKSILTKEPTDNLVGGLIRGVLTHQWKTRPDVLQLLFAADRGHHLDSKVVPALDSGYHVVSDRYFFSSIAFGGLELDFDWIKSVNKNYLLPDVVFLVKVPPQTCLERIHNTRFSVELFERLEKLERVWKNYERLSTDQDYERVFCVVDGTRSLDEVQSTIRRELVKRLGL